MFLDVSVSVGKSFFISTTGGGVSVLSFFALSAGTVRGGCFPTPNTMPPSVFMGLNTTLDVLMPESVVGRLNGAELPTGFEAEV